ncbi:enoyl-CoA hydratase-related protein [Halomonas piscis]|uniref:Enoyl-CoA hydratase-related protein n=1 Tax=Halomonas piscis TaxID=3031727 RepID=A0ABY9YZF4_9GAMM|nr:enoyl-CoA hydratase-related protein [Halomonas piscis]WNK19444.1 enoyl-CoA hydratase-related protein [Halomonas piscis]
MSAKTETTDHLGAADSVVAWHRHEGVVRLTVNRPKALNALNEEVIEALETALDALERDAELRGVLISGAGDKAFVAGADITRMRELTAPEARAFAGRAQTVLKRLERLPVPVVALVNGFCLGGGCELALACDWAVAGDNAVFGQPEVQLGIIPGFGGTQRLPRRVGPAMALELVTTGRKIDAAEALRIGLVNQVMPQAELDTYAETLGDELRASAPGAVGTAKRALYDGMEQPLDSALALETGLFALCFAGDEQAEGMAAFVEKRPARF